MNKDKVYLKGYVIGRAADTLGYHGLMVQLENLDIVEIDKNLVHKGINEPQKVTVPQFVADWYEKNKNNLDYNIWNYVYDWEDQEDDEFRNWFNNSKDAFQTLVNMHQFGCTVGKEKRYLVKLKGMNSESEYLYYGTGSCTWRFREKNESGYFRKNHTRKELEVAGFGEVFDSPLFEVEEVE
jgi:hypothetical protein